MRCTLLVIARCSQSTTQTAQSTTEPLLLSRVRLPHHIWYCTEDADSRGCTQQRRGHSYGCFCCCCCCCSLSDISLHVCAHSDRQYCLDLKPSLKTIISLRIEIGPRPGAPVSSSSSMIAKVETKATNILTKQQSEGNEGVDAGADCVYDWDRTQTALL